MVAGTAPPVDHHSQSNWHTVRVVHTSFGALLVCLHLCQTLPAGLCACQASHELASALQESCRAAGLLYLK